MNLAVCIGDADIIHIDQGDSANARASKRLRCPRANTSNTNNAYMSLAKGFIGLITIESANAAKSLFVSQFFLLAGVQSCVFPAISVFFEFANLDHLL